MTDLQAALGNRFGEHRVSILPTKEGEISLRFPTFKYLFGEVREF